MTKEEQAKKDAEMAALKSALKTVFWEVVNGQINGNKEHGWGKEDSMAVVESIIAEDASLSAAETGKYTPSEAAMERIEAVINPSQFRQMLEAKGTLTKVESKRKGVMKALLAEMESE